MNIQNWKRTLLLGLAMAASHGISATSHAQAGHGYDALSRALTFVGEGIRETERYQFHLAARSAQQAEFELRPYTYDRFIADAIRDLSIAASRLSDPWLNSREKYEQGIDYLQSAEAALLRSQIYERPGIGRQQVLRLLEASQAIVRRGNLNLTLRYLDSATDLLGRPDNRREAVALISIRHAEAAIRDPYLNLSQKIRLVLEHTDEAIRKLRALPFPEPRPLPPLPGPRPPRPVPGPRPLPRPVPVQMWTCSAAGLMHPGDNFVGLSSHIQSYAIQSALSACKDGGRTVCVKKLCWSNY